MSRDNREHVLDKFIVGGKTVDILTPNGMGARMGEGQMAIFFCTSSQTVPLTISGGRLVMGQISLGILS